MHAYNANMEGARREVSADIGWPESDGHHGIPILNMPLGLPRYMQAYMCGKAEELQEEALLKHCMQHMAGYSLSNCLPSKVVAFAEAVDATRVEATSLREDAVARAHRKLHLPTRLKDAGLRRMLATICDAAFIGCMNDILPMFLTRNSDTNTPTHNFFDPLLESVLGRSSFNASSSARRYDHFLDNARGSASYAAAVRET
eukprot:jgi/Tetstr1/463923/TSEL_008730.t1